MAYCINCGAADSLEYEGVDLFFEAGTYHEDAGCYEHEGDLSVLRCTECNHEMIDLSGQYGDLTEEEVDGDKNDDV